MNPKNFKVSVPTTTELTIKQAALLPYASFKPAPSGLAIFGMPEPYPALSKWMTETKNSVMEIRFPPAIRRKWGWKAKNNRQKKEDSYDWMDYLHLQPDDRAKLLSNPQNSITDQDKMIIESLIRSLESRLKEKEKAQQDASVDG